ncbi:uncharacterized protein LOC144435135 isoform X2 [Glandiceps talaboti]
MALSGMKALQVWCQRTTEGYRDVKVTNMTTSWRDGLAFCAIIHKYRPDVIDFDSLSKENVFENNKLAFETAEKELGITALLDAEDMVAMAVPDKLSIMTYVSQYYNYFQRNIPGGTKPVKGYKRTSTSPEVQHKKIIHVEKDKEQDKGRGKVDSKSSSLELLKQSHRGSSFGDKCAACGKKVYLLERHVASGKLYHRACFRCKDCKATLRPGSYKITDGNQFECTLHKKDCHKKPTPGPKFLGKDKKSSIERDNDKKKEEKKTSGSEIGYISNVNAKKKLFENGSAVSVSKTDDRSKKSVLTVSSPTKGDRKDISQPIPPVNDAAMRSGLLQSLAAVRKREVVKIENKETKVTCSEPLKEDETLLKTCDVTDTKNTRQNKIDVDESKKELKEINVDESGQGDDKKVGSAVVCDTQLSGKDKDGTGDDVAMKTEDDDPLQILEDMEVTEKDVEKDAEDEDLKTDGDDEYVSAEDNNPFAESSDDNNPFTECAESADDKNPFAESDDDSPTGKVEGVAAEESAEKIIPPGDKVSPDDVLEIENKTDIKVVIDTESDINNAQINVDVGVTDNNQDVKNIEEKDSEKQEDVENAEVVATSKDSETNKDTVSVKSNEEENVNQTDDVRRENLSDGVKGEKLEENQKEEEADDESYNPFFGGDDEEEGEEEAKDVQKGEVAANEELEDYNPFSSHYDEKSDDDEEIDPSKNPFTGSPIDSEETLVNPFTGSPVQKRKFNYPDNASSKYNTAHPTQRTPSGVKSRADVLRELQGSMARQQKKVPPPRPPPPKSHTLQTGSALDSKPATPSPGSIRKPAPTPPGKDQAPSPSRPARKSRRAPPPPPPGGSPVVVVKATNVQSSGAEQPQAPPRSPKLKRNDVSQKLDEVTRPASPGEPPAKPKRQPELSERPSRNLSPGSKGGRTSSPSPSVARIVKRRAPPPPAQRRKVNKSMTAEDIKQELTELDKLQTELEEKGVIMEKQLREGMEGDVSQEAEEEMLKHWFELINNKNGLVRRENELIYLSQQQSLEEEHADVEFELRCLMQKSPTMKTDEDKTREEELIERLMEIVGQRNRIVESMEQDRLREYEEDKTLEAMMIQKGWIEGEDQEVQKKEKKKDKKGKEKKEKHKEKDKKKDKEKKKDKGKKEVKKEVEKEENAEEESPKKTKHGVFYL